MHTVRFLRYFEGKGNVNHRDLMIDGLDRHAVRFSLAFFRWFSSRKLTGKGKGKKGGKVRRNRERN